MKLLAFAASLRAGSLNRKLIHLAAGLARERGAEVDLADFRDFEMPYFDGDLHARVGLPEATLEMARRIQAADGMLIASPEYNFSIPGTLKNSIDWVSRIRPVPFRGKSCFLLGASNSQVGGIRGLWQLRIPLEGLGVWVAPDMFALGEGREAFEDDGTLKDPARRERLVRMLDAYLDGARRLAGG